MRRQFNNVRTFVQDKVQDLNQSSRALSSNVISSISSLGKKDEKDNNKIFGVPLSQHLASSDREISVVIESCIAFLLPYVEEEGLFRIPGSLAEVKRLKSGFETGLSDLTDRVRDPHAVAGTLKSYLRELPEPLLTHSLYPDWIEAAQIPDPKERLNALRRVCDRLSHENLVNLRYLVKFLDLLSRYSEVNKMSSQNIAMAITPSLMWAPAGENGENTMAMDMSATNVHSVVVYNLISHANFFFPEDVTFTTAATFAANENNRLALRNAPPEPVRSESPMPQQPKLTPRRAPKKPAPPVPPPPVVSHESNSPDKCEIICVNNNNEKGFTTVTFRVSDVSFSGDEKKQSARNSPDPSSNEETLSSTTSSGHHSNLRPSFDSASLDRRVTVRRNNSDNGSQQRRTHNRKSALSLQRPTIPPPERPTSATFSSTFSRQRSVDDILKSSPPSARDMSRSTEVLNSKQLCAAKQCDKLPDDTAVHNQSDENAAKPEIVNDKEDDCSHTSRREEAGMLFSHKSLSDESPPACSLKSFRRIDSPDSFCTSPAKPDVPLHRNDSSQSEHSAPEVPNECLTPKSAPKKPPRKSKSKSGAGSDSPSPRPPITPVEAAHFSESHIETTTDSQSERNDSIQSVDGFKSGSSTEQEPESLDLRVGAGDSGDVPECSPPVASSEKTAHPEGDVAHVAPEKPPKPAPPPKPKVVLSGYNSSYL